jgi:hypothetical protein
MGASERVDSEEKIDRGTFSALGSEHDAKIQGVCQRINIVQCDLTKATTRGT